MTRFGGSFVEVGDNLAVTLVDNGLAGLFLRTTGEHADDISCSHHEIDDGIAVEFPCGCALDETGASSTVAVWLGCDPNAVVVASVLHHFVHVKLPLVSRVHDWVL